MMTDRDEPTGLPKMLPSLKTSEGRPGFGVRHPALLALLDRFEPETVEDIVWPDGMRLRVAAYVASASVPDEIVTSVRCIVTVGDCILLVHAPDEQHVLPGGRRLPGESYAATVCREVHEETGWIIDPNDLRLLGFLHFCMYDEQPDTHPYPHPDFLQVIYTAPARVRDGNGIDWSDLDEWELGSRLVTREEIASVPLKPSQRAFLAASDS